MPLVYVKASVGSVEKHNNLRPDGSEPNDLKVTCV